MKIVADENIPHLGAFFAEFGEVVALPGRNLRPGDVADADALIVRSVTRVNSDLLEGSSVRFVGTCTIGIDHLDTRYLARRGITYASAPGCNAGGVVQYVLAALAALRPGWQRSRIGVIGCGNVGGRLCSTLLSLHVDCIAYDPFLMNEDYPVLASLDEVLECDIVCLHTPYTTSGPYPTHHLIDAARLRQLKPGALLLNAGRGGAVDNRALLDHLQSGADLQVVLDVWENEPQIDLELAARVAVGTPHIAGYSYEGKVNGASMIYEALARFLGANHKEASARSAAIAGPLKGPRQLLDCQRVDQAVLATYDILADHQRTKAALRGLSDMALGAGFDHLRKTYPERREFSHYCVHTGDSVTDRALARLGFDVHA